MAGPLNTTNSVKAKVQNQPSFEEGDALEDLEPGQGVVRGDGGFEAAGADSATRRVVREQRNPGSRGIEDDESPLEKDYPVGANVETLGFQSHDEARLRVENTGTEAETITEGTDLGWNADGYLDSTADESVVQAVNDEDVTIAAGETEIVLVEFY